MNETYSIKRAKRGQKRPEKGRKRPQKAPRTLNNIYRET
jgi:hypothetical protein